MNAVGVDYQSSHCVVALREGLRFPPRIRSVGDGVRQVIPNPAGAPNDAAAARAFWRALATRLYTFLGHIQPIADNGYEVVVATSAAAEWIGQAADAAGLTDHSCIAPGDALVARWLTEMTGWKDERGVAVERVGLRAERGQVVAIAVGDSRTTIASYNVGDDGRGLPRVDRGPLREIDSGYLAWLAIFFDRVRERLAEVGDMAHDATLFDSSAEFGAKLRATPPGKVVEWRGPWPERLYAPLRVTREECESWGAIRDWMQTVATLVGDFALGQQSRSVARILVGGIGAVWPFAADAVSRWGDVWQTVLSWLDVAGGAAWWSEVRFCFSGESQASRSSGSVGESFALADIPLELAPDDYEPVLTLSHANLDEASRDGTRDDIRVRPDVLAAGNSESGNSESGNSESADPEAAALNPSDDRVPPDADDRAAAPSLDDIPPWERHGDPET